MFTKKGKRGKKERGRREELFPTKYKDPYPVNWIKFLVLSVTTSILLGLSSHWETAIMALPPLEDIPEEILRTEIIIDARSPIDGKPLTAGEYAELQEQLQISPPPKLTPNIRQTIFLLRLRKALLPIFPFLNF